MPTLSSALRDTILQSVDAAFEAQLQFTEALVRFPSTRGQEGGCQDFLFETYAGIKIKGAMLDELRKLSWAPRSVNEKPRRLAQAVRVVESRNGGQAPDQVIATGLSRSLDEYHSLLHETASCQLVLLQDTHEGESQELDAGPEAIMQDDRFKAALMSCIDRLPDNEKVMMALYYQEDLNLKEIGQVLEVSESQVSQIHSQALTRIHAKMVDWT